jgi:hypothetical protein
MKTRKMAAFAVALAVSALIGAGILRAHSQTAGHQAQHQQPGHQEPEREVFCSGLSAGQLCLHGTPNVLKLDGAKKDQWIQAARGYNKGVDASTKHLLAQAKKILSPEEYASVEKWFDKGLNPVLNQVLLGDQTSHK